MYLESRRSDSGGLIVSLVIESPEETALLKHYPDLTFFEILEPDPECVSVVDTSFFKDDWAWKLNNLRWEAHIYPQNEDAYERFVNSVADRLEAMKLRIEEVDYFTRSPQLHLMKSRSV